MLIEIDPTENEEPLYVANVYITFTGDRKLARKVDWENRNDRALWEFVSSHERVKKAELINESETHIRRRHFKRELTGVTHDEAWAYADGMAAWLKNFPLSSNPFTAIDTRDYWIFGYFDHVEKWDVNGGSFDFYEVSKVAGKENTYNIRFFWEVEV